MKLEFDIDSIRKNNLELLDCQIDLLLKSLELYSHTYQFICPRRGISETPEEDLRICLVTDTYDQILNQFATSKLKNPIMDNSLNETEKYFKKIA